MTVSTSTPIADAVSTSFALSAASTVVQVLDTLLLSSAEQVYVTEVSGTTVSIDRGQNGTVASSHSVAASIQVYRYPEPVVAACELQALRIWRRRDAPFGVVGAGGIGVSAGEIGTVVVIPKLDPDVMGLLDGAMLRRKSWAAV